MIGRPELMRDPRFATQGSRAANVHDIYNFLGEDLSPHDPKNIEPCYDMIEFDQRLGTPGLHDVGRSVPSDAQLGHWPNELFLPGPAWPNHAR